MNLNLPEIPRREFVRRAALGAVGATFGLAAACETKAATNGKIPIGLELYSIRDQCKTDLAGMLVAVSKIGYKGVEFAGYHGHSAKELRKMLDDNGLVACGTHAPYETVLPDKLSQTIEFNRTIGNNFLIVPSMSARSKQQWRERAKQFNELAEKVKPEGMFVGYHAHGGDFKKIEGETPWDLFAGNTKPAVILQLDTSNCCDGGADPVAVLKKYPGRTRTIHIKPHGAGPDSVIGEDKINWTEIFAFCEGPGKTDWYVVEHETSKDPLNTVKRTFEALHAMGKV